FARAAARAKSAGESSCPASGKPANKVSLVVVMLCARATNSKHCNKSSWVGMVLGGCREASPASGVEEVCAGVVFNDGSGRIEQRQQGRNETNKKDISS